jgi:TrmH family RNA methyltransferase
MDEITSRKNPLVLHLKKLGADCEYRRQSKEYLCDGPKLLREAVHSGAGITAVLTSGSVPDFLPDGVPVYRVKHGLIETVSPLKSPQDIVFSCVLPDAHAGPEGFQIILEGIQDPGNVGTILRTAGAMGVARVILTGGCADPYNPKAVRASMGAIFRQPHETAELDTIAALKEHGVKIYGAAVSGDCLDVREADFHNAAVAVGSEGRGLTDDMLRLCDKKVKIPMAENAESLNAATAAGIIMWEAARISLTARHP